MRVVLSTCPFCSCGCGLYLQSRRGSLVGVAPAQSHPIAQGRLCARGWAAHEASLWGPRLTRPLVRRGGALQPASWDEALEQAARGLAALPAESVGVLGSARATNEESYLLARLARLVLRTPNIDHCNRVTYQPLLDGIGDVASKELTTISFDAIERCKVIVLVEGDLVHDHPRAAHAVMVAVRRGARLVTVGAARTQLARLAALHLETRPGSEGLVADQLMAAVLQGAGKPVTLTDQYNGFEPLSRALAGVRVTERSARVAGWLTTARRAAFLLCPTAAEPAALRRNAAAFTSLAALTRHLGRPGSGVLPLVGRCNFRGALDMGVTPDRLPGSTSLSSPQERRRIEATWGGSLAHAVGLDAGSMLESVEGLLCLRPDLDDLQGLDRAVLEAKRFIVALDSYRTPTTEVAHVVLPVASHAESRGTITSMEGQIQELRPAVEPPGEAREGWRALGDLAVRLGGRSVQSMAKLRQEIADVVPAYSIHGDGWRTAVPGTGEGGRLQSGAGDAPPREDGLDWVIALEGGVSWDEDPLVRFSPTLGRESASRAKLLPDGVVGIAPEDAKRLGVRQGWRVKLTTERGAKQLPVELRPDLMRGVLLVPFALKRHVAPLLGRARVAAVRVERV